MKEDKMSVQKLEEEFHQAIFEDIINLAKYFTGADPETIDLLSKNEIIRFVDLHLNNLMTDVTKERSFMIMMVQKQHTLEDLNKLRFKMLRNPAGDFDQEELKTKYATIIDEEDKDDYKIILVSVDKDVPCYLFEDEYGDDIFTKQTLVKRNNRYFIDK